MSKRKIVSVSQEELERQKQIMNELRNKNEEYYKLTGRRKTFFTQTYGCPVV
jgi:tRNA-2-methylthio-N6-dimethylallyladenosine synthase